jgi:hypothetical protein
MTVVIDQHDLRTRRGDTMREVFRFVGVDENFSSEEFRREHNTRAEKYGPRKFAAKIMEPVIYPVARAIPRPINDVIRAPAQKVLIGQVRESPVLSEEMRARPRQHLRPEVEGRREFSGKAFATWSL